MPTIKFKKKFTDLTVEPKANLMTSLLQGGIPVASSCNGEGVCTKCRIRIISGQENLSPENQTEKELREIHDIPKDERVSCQTEVNGDVTVDTDYW